MRFLSLFIACAIALFAQPSGVSTDALRAHIRFLASDLLEGRAPGTRGAELTVEYLASAFEAAGAKPAGDNNTFFQAVPLTGVKVSGQPVLKIGDHSLAWSTDFVGTSQSQETQVRFSDAPMVFVGHGIRAPEYNWDDYQGIDVRGKIVVLFTGEPASEDPKFFDGIALTYYGRWTYKFEEATRQGAVGALIIHTTETASYGWNVVENSWSREDVQLRREPGSHALRFAAWVHSSAAAKAGLNVTELLDKAGKPGFVPQPLTQRLNLNFDTVVRNIESRNVAARVEGSDPSLRQEHVIFSAHWDHLGVGGNGNDRIYNGAVDNATGCAMLVEFARHWASLSPRPKRSILLLAVAAEESGLRGSEYYARHPLIPIAATKAALNVDAIVPGGKPAGLVVTGAEKTPVFGAVKEVAKRHQLEILPDPNPRAGSYFRSDHFSFAKVGIPAFSVAASGVSGDAAKTYGAERYHQPGDEYSPDWDMTSIETIANVTLRLGISIASKP